MNLETIATVVANAIEENNKHLATGIQDLRTIVDKNSADFALELAANKSALKGAIDQIKTLTEENAKLRAELEAVGKATVDTLEKHAKSIDHIDERTKGIEHPSIDIEAIADQVSARFEKRFSDHLIHHERRATDTLAEAVKSIPAPKDALPVDSFDLELADDGRTLTVALKCGEQVVSKQVRVPTVLYRGVYKKGAEYDAQDSVTDGGCVWIAKCKTNKRPGDDNSDWQMAVKKGRDGIDLRENASTYDPSKPVKI